MPKNILKPQFALLDSCVWIALFSEKDKFHNEAIAKMAGLNEYFIYMTAIIHSEVINVLSRRSLTKESIKNVEKYFQSMKIRYVPGKTDYAMIRKARRHIGIVNLKTLDLLIMSSVIDLKPDYFYTFDEVFMREYNKYYDEEKH